MLTPQEMMIANDRASGATIRQIATQTSLDKSNVSRKLQKPEMQAYLQRLQEAIINKTLAKALGNIHYAVTKYKDKESDAQLRDHGYKASVKVMESVGILPSHAPSLIFQQFNQVNNEIHLEAAAETALKHLGMDVIDADPVDNQGENG